MQLATQRLQVESLKVYADTARLRYDNGYTSFLEVVDAERSLFNAQLSYTQTQQVLLQASINLYKAMGGGWMAQAAKSRALRGGERRGTGASGSVAGRTGCPVPLRRSE